MDPIRLALDDLEITVRAANCIKAENIYTSATYPGTEDELLKRRPRARRSRDKEVLASRG